MIDNSSSLNMTVSSSSLSSSSTNSNRQERQPKPVSRQRETAKVAALTMYHEKQQREEEVEHQGGSYGESSNYEYGQNSDEEEFEVADEAAYCQLAAVQSSSSAAHSALTSPISALGGANNSGYPFPPQSREEVERQMGITAFPEDWLTHQ